MTAETECRYISWRRRRLYMLLSKERYIARIFSVMLGGDIADKLYALNDKLFAKSGVRLDIRLPSLYHVLAPSPPGSEGDGRAPGPPEEQLMVEEEDPAPAYQQSAPPQPQDAQEGEDQTPPAQRQAPLCRQPRTSDTEPPSGEDSTSLVLEDFADMTGSLMDYGSERDYLR